MMLTLFCVLLQRSGAFTKFFRWLRKTGESQRFHLRSKLLLNFVLFAYVLVSGQLDKVHDIILQWAKQGRELRVLIVGETGT